MVITKEINKMENKFLHNNINETTNDTILMNSNKINNNEVLTLSVEDAAIQAGFSRSSMYNWCKKNANEIPFKVVSLGRSLRIEKNSFYEWIYGTKMVS